MSEVEITRLLAQMRSMAESAQGGKPAEAAGQGEQPDFSAMLKQSIDQVNELQQNAGKLSGAFEAGSPDVTLPEVMLALQKANISFQAMTQVRNKLVQAYQDIMNMPV